MVWPVVFAWCRPQLSRHHRKRCSSLRREKPWVVVRKWLFGPASTWLGCVMSPSHIITRRLAKQGWKSCKREGRRKSPECLVGDVAGCNMCTHSVTITRRSTVSAAPARNNPHFLPAQGARWASGTRNLAQELAAASVLGGTSRGEMPKRQTLGPWLTMPPRSGKVEVDSGFLGPSKFSETREGAGLEP